MNSNLVSIPAFLKNGVTRVFKCGDQLVTFGSYVEIIDGTLFLNTFKLKSNAQIEKCIKFHFSMKNNRSDQFKIKIGVTDSGIVTSIVYCEKLDYHNDDFIHLFQSDLNSGNSKHVVIPFPDYRIKQNSDEIFYDRIKRIKIRSIKLSKRGSHLYFSLRVISHKEELPLFGLYKTKECLKMNPCFDTEFCNTSPAKLLNVSYKGKHVLLHLSSGCYCLFNLNLRTFLQGACFLNKCPSDKNRIVLTPDGKHFFHRESPSVFDQWRLVNINTEYVTEYKFSNPPDFQFFNCLKFKFITSDLLLGYTVDVDQVTLMPSTYHFSTIKLNDDSTITVHRVGDSTTKIVTFDQHNNPLFHSNIYQ